MTPDFFVVGTQKAGTTTLHDWLAMSPDLALPSIKETHFFCDDERFKNGIDWYKSWFKVTDETRVVGEIDPEYMFFTSAPSRISDQCPQPKFIFIFRNILDRAYSHYQMSVRRGYEKLGFAEALAIEKERLSCGDKATREHALIHQSYWARGQYCEQIALFKHLFPESPMLFLKFDELISKDQRVQTYCSVCEFIGIQPVSEKVDFDACSNPASLPRFVFLRDLLYGKSGIKKMLGKLIPSSDLKLKLAMFLDRLNQVRITAKPLSWRQEVPDAYWVAADEEIERLEQMTGLDCSSWKRLKSGEPKP